MSTPETDAAAQTDRDPDETPAQARRREWTEHVARTTAVLAVLAAVSSGQYASQFSHTILKQTEASDQWSYYQAKSIKRHVVGGQVELLKALALTRPEAAEALHRLQADDAATVAKYEKELVDIKAKADALEIEKTRHQQQGDRFQFAFVVLQAGVVLSTVAASARRRELWILAIACGLLGLALVLNGVFLWDLRWFHGR